jgi:hypothetical protein
LIGKLQSNLHDTGQLIRWKAELVCEVVSPSFAALPLSVIQSGLVLESGDVFEEKSIYYRVRDRLAHLWPVEPSKASLLVPPTSIVTTTQHVFVIRNNNGKAQWVNVRKGPSAGNLVEVEGDLKAGDEVVERATDEIREGSELKLTTE